MACMNGCGCPKFEALASLAASYIRLLDLIFVDKQPSKKLRFAGQL
jgi:hypothetical protein